MKVVIKDKTYTRGDIIRMIREWNDQTQKEFAKEIGKSTISIQKYEADEVNYGIQVLFDLMHKHKVVITIEKKFIVKNVPNLCLIIFIYKKIVEIQRFISLWCHSGARLEIFIKVNF